MKSLVVAFVVAGTSSAWASPATKPIEKLAKDHVVALGNLEKNPGLADDAIVVLPTGADGNLGDDGCVAGIANDFYGCVQASIDHKVGTVVAGLDAAHGVGWFQAPFTVTMSGQDVEGHETKPTRHAMRAGGIAVRIGTSSFWEIAAIGYTRPISDKDLLAGTGGKPATGAPKITGDAKLAQAAATWVAGGFAAHAGTDPASLIASGTSPTEMASGAGALKLAKSWDKLKLGVTAINAKTVADGAAGWVRAEVTMPRKSGKGAVEMILLAVAVPDGASWRWVSLQFLSTYSPMAR